MAVAVIAGGSAIAIFGTSDTGGNDYYEPTTRLLVYGNANNDNYLDQKDVDFIRDIVEKRAVWDSKNNARADANVDGVVTKEDLELVEKFVRGESATMYYTNWDGNIRSISYPLTGTIGGYDTNTLDLLTIIGVEDRMTASGDTAETIAQYNKTMYPGAAERCMSIRGDNRDYKAELVFDSGIKILLGGVANSGDDFVEKLHAGDPTINVIQLPIGFYGNLDSTYTIITLACMMNLQENVSDYIDYIEKIEKKIDQSVKAISEKYGNEAFIIMYRLGEAGPGVTNIDTIGAGPSQFGDVMNVMKLPITPTMTVPGDRGYLKGVPIEKVLATNPDIIFVETFNKLSSNDSDEAIKADFQKRIDMIDESEAYANNRVITLTYEVIGSTPGMSAILAVAALLWPDMFDYNEALDIMNEYYRNFTHAGADFDVRDHFGYAPLLWGPDNTH